MSSTQRESVLSRKRASITSQRPKASASIVTQKTTLPQIETITHRDQAYQVRHLSFSHQLNLFLCFL